MQNITLSTSISQWLLANRGIRPVRFVFAINKISFHACLQHGCVFDGYWQRGLTFRSKFPQSDVQL
jgi:hypothetical protein